MEGDGVTFIAPTDEAWKHFDSVLENMRSNRRSDDHHGEQKDIENILRYHIVKDVIETKDLFGGQLLETALKESNLNSDCQKIRVNDFLGQLYLVPDE